MFSLPAKAETSISSVERGKWKLVTSRSTTRKRKPGTMKILVSAAPATILPSSWIAAAASRARSAVVPTATTRPFFFRVAAIAPTVACGMSYHSECITCRETSSTRTGWNVPAPTWSVSEAKPTPLARRRASGAGLAGIHGLVARFVVGFRRVGDVRRQRHFALTREDVEHAFLETQL